MKRMIVEGEAQCALVLRLLKMHAEVKEGEPDAVLAEQIIEKSTSPRLPTTAEVDAAFQIAATDGRWSINKIPVVRKMLMAANAASSVDLVPDGPKPLRELVGDF